MSRPLNVNPAEWELSLSIARKICADFFKKGCTARDVLKAYGVPHDEFTNWQLAIDSVAVSHCQQALPRAA